MQNRTSRNLLFGTRAAHPSGSADTESLEAENQRAVDRLGGSASSVKDIAIAIDADVADQNRLLDRVDKRFDTTSSVITSTLTALNDLVNDRTAFKMSSLVVFFFVVMVILYFLSRR